MSAEAIEEFGRLIQQGREIQRKTAEAAYWKEFHAPFWARVEALFSGMQDDTIKALWDQYDGANEPGGFAGEDIHAILNCRGHGDYCAV